MQADNEIHINNDLVNQLNMKQKIDQKVMHKQHSVEKAKLQA